MVTFVRALLAIFILSFSTFFVRDLVKNKDKIEKEGNFLIAIASGFLANFFDTLGIGSFAILTAVLRGFKQIKDRVIPGTLNVSCTIPVALEAFIFITIINVDPLTLILMFLSATVGSFVVAGYVAKLSERNIQRVVGMALLVVAFFMFSQHMNLIDRLGTGQEIGLRGWKLAIALIVNCLLGGLQASGIGMYAPSMALVYMLGMSPRVVFPIMMTSSAFTLPPASINFIRNDGYNRKISSGIVIGGIFGVLIAAYIVKTLPLDILKWFVIGIVLFTSLSLLRKAFK